MASSMSRKAVSGILIAAAVVLLPGCTRGSGDLEAWVAEVRARPAPPLDPLPVMKQFETFEYAAQNLRDPFSQPAADSNSSKVYTPALQMATIVISSVPILMVYPFLQKHFAKGILVGSIKG